MTTGIGRRDFVRDVLAAGAAIAASTAWARTVPNGAARNADDRSTDRDPMALQRSTLVVNGLDPSSLRSEYLDMLRTGGVDCWHRSAGDLADFATMLAFCDQHTERIAPAASVREIRQLHQQGKLSLISGWQSAETLIIEGDLDGPAIGNLRAYHQLGLRVCGIAYNVSNSFGAGCLEPQIGLTRAGRRLVEEIHERRIVLDVGGHTGEQTSLDALAMSAGVPVICTHTNILTLTDNPRCTSDRVLEAIAKTGGVIGVTAFNDFHVRTRRDVKILRMPQVDLDRHLDQYDYLRKLVGVDHIGLGPDFIEGRNDIGSGSPQNRNLMAPEAYSQELPWLYVKDFENIGQLPNVTQGLLKRGWSTAEVRKVLGENWLRVYERVWGA